MTSHPVLYVYVLGVTRDPRDMGHDTAGIFTWPNAVKKYIRDVYSDANGVLTLPPKGWLSLKRYKVNPKAGQAVVVDTLDIEKFMGETLCRAMSHVLAPASSSAVTQ